MAPASCQETRAARVEQAPLGSRATRRERRLIALIRSASRLVRSLTSQCEGSSSVSELCQSPDDQGKQGEAPRCKEQARPVADSAPESPRAEDLDDLSGSRPQPVCAVHPVLASVDPRDVARAVVTADDSRLDRVSGNQLVDGRRPDQHEERDAEHEEASEDPAASAARHGWHDPRRPTTARAKQPRGLLGGGAKNAAIHRRPTLPAEVTSSRRCSARGPGPARCRRPRTARQPP